MRRYRSWYRIRELRHSRLPLPPGPLADSLALWLQGTLLAENGCLDRVAALAARGGNVHTLCRRLCDGLKDDAERPEAWGTDQELDAEACCAPLLAWVLSWMVPSGPEVPPPLVLAVDPTHQADRLVALTVSVVLNQTALPVDGTEAHPAPLGDVQAAVLDAHVGRDGEGGLGVVPGLVLRTPVVGTVRVEECGVGIAHVLAGVPDDFVAVVLQPLVTGCVPQLREPLAQRKEGRTAGTLPQLPECLPHAVVRLVPGQHVVPGEPAGTGQLFKVPAVRGCAGIQTHAQGPYDGRGLLRCGLRGAGHGVIFTVSG